MSMPTPMPVLPKRFSPGNISTSSRMASAMAGPPKGSPYKAWAAARLTAASTGSSTAAMAVGTLGGAFRNCLRAVRSSNI